MKHTKLLFISYFVFISCSSQLPRPQDSSEKIVGGTQVTLGSDIYQATVGIGQYIPGTRNEFAILCTGTLIHKRWVLTAAHCLDLRIVGTPPTHIVFGVDIADLKSYVTIKKTHIRKPFDPNALDIPLPNSPPNDIGLIELASDAPGKIASFLSKSIAPGSQVILAGFGAASVREAELIDPYWPKLRQVTVSIKSLNTAAKEIVYHGGRGKSACVGDSGGPMFWRKKDGSLAVVGITSRSGPSDKMCDEDGVYTDSTPHMDWILSTTGFKKKKL